MQAIGEFILVKEIKGVIATSNAQIREGEVLSVGKKVEDIKKGDKVVFDTFKAINHKDCWMVKGETVGIKL